MTTSKKNMLLISIFTHFSLLLSLPSFSDEAFKKGDEYPLKVYSGNNSIYLKIEDTAPHPYLDAIYIISFHGICMTSKRFFSAGKEADSDTDSDTEMIALYPAIISKEALKKSIDFNRQVSKRNIKECEVSLPMDSKDILELVSFGNQEVQITPFDKDLSLIENRDLLTLVTNK